MLNTSLSQLDKNHNFGTETILVELFQKDFFWKIGNTWANIFLRKKHSNKQVFLLKSSKNKKGSGENLMKLQGLESSGFFQDALISGFSNIRLKNSALKRDFSCLFITLRSEHTNYFWRDLSNDEKRSTMKTEINISKKF